MLRQIKPRNARSKRALEKREPKAQENPKTALFLRGSSCSQVTQDALNELYQLRQPLAKRFVKKNDIHPFDNADSIEFFSEKNDTSIVVFGHTSKKRPHALTLIRTFGHKVLDMLELYLDPDTFRTLAQFKGKKVPIGLKPMLVFSGTAWDSPIANEYTHARSFFIDFFRGENTDKIDVEGLQWIVSITADEPAGTDVVDAKPQIRLRAYTISTKRSGQKVPRVEVTEIGPRMDFRVGRTREPDEAMPKEAMKKARGTEERTKKNISTDAMGDKVGRVHVGRQDLGDLQTRKMKGLKRSRDVASEDEGEKDADEETKKSRKA
ncbi:Ribosome biogenesis protein RPF2 [Colletotrichum orbiculare MAFF 240422]|uniref:Ribosome production factor 2 homolog n=1 Tax=Colletotrichum orbiculare (strain 104-T / ATCC 96160 / CBS 514.97 / LARS 414 / MAFF 240422) TaxID=1213857 RepID=N4VMN6_COLOR|nr:Ribosome biogenesis protein RPF2 [Colletotrichum orbiculare MAFF 240422]